MSSFNKHSNEKLTYGTSHLREITLIASIIAVVTISTCTLKVPTPLTGGYTNLGDIIVISSGFLLGSRRGALIGGIGSALADLIAGYTIFTPATLIIKGIEGYLAGKIGKDLNKNNSFSLRLFGGLAGAMSMVGGYFLYERVVMVWFGLAKAVAAYSALFPNFLQGIAGVTGALFLLPLLEKAYFFRDR